MRCKILMTAILYASAFAAQPGEPGKSLSGKPLRPPRVDDVRNLDTFVRAYLNAARARGSISPELERMADAALRASPPRPPTEESEREDYSTAYRLLTQLLIRLPGGEWTNEMEFASAFDFQIGASVLTPGEPATYRIEPWFTTEWMPPAALTARVELRSFAGQVIAMRDIAVREFTPHSGSFPTARLQAGRYLVRYDLIGAAAKPLASADREFQISRDAKRRAASLQTKLPQFRERHARGASFAIAAETVEFIAVTVARACNEHVVGFRFKQSHPFLFRLIRGSPIDPMGFDSFDLSRDLSLAEGLAEDMLLAKEPFAQRTGDMHLAYRSRVDRALQPFRVFIPEGFDRSRKYPLIVALHGGGADENGYMDWYISPHTGKNLFKQLGQEHGYILVAPNGRGPSSRYVGDAEQDVLDVLDLAQQLYPVNRSEVFLTGHSMGGTGTWSIGFKYPERFAAVAPVATSFLRNWADFEGLPFDKASAMPVLFSYALKDNTAAPEDTRKMAAHAKRVLTSFRANEYPDDDHFSIGVASMQRIFDFFNEQRKGRAGREQQR